MAEANKMFSGGLAGYDEAQRKAQENAVSQKEMEERTKASVSVMEKLQLVMQQLAVAVQPLVNFLHGFFDAILAVNDATGGLLVPVLLGAVAVYALVYNGIKHVMMAKGLLAAAQGKEAAQMTASQIATMNKAAADQTAAAAQTQAALACDKETLCKSMNTGCLLYTSPSPRDRG